MSFNQNSGTAVPILINSSQVLLTGNAASANALTVRQFGTGNVFSAQTTSGTTALFVAGSGNVGIGTTSPATALDVNGILTTRSDIYTTPATTTLYSNTFSFKFNDVTAGAAGNPLVKIDSSGANSGSNQILQMGLDGTIFNKTAYLDTVTGGVSATVPIAFRISGSEKMRVHTTGNVGIGTTNPGSLFTLYGNNTISGSIALTGPTEGSPSYIYKGLAVPAGNTGTRPYLGLTATNGTAQSNIFIWGDQNNIGPVISMSTTQYQFWNSAQTSQYMTILSSGNVGIGTASPTFKLDVSGGIRAAVNGSTNSTETATNGIYAYAPGGISGNASIWMGFDPTDDCGYINSARSGQYRPVCLQTRGGNVGIGTTSPGGYGQPRLWSANDVTLIAGNYAGDVNAQIMAVGTTNPLKRLALMYDTTNNIGLVQAQIAGTGTSPLCLNAAGGNVGIGTTNPQRPLHISAPQESTSGLGPCTIDCTTASGFTDVVFLVRSKQAQGSSFNLALFQASTTFIGSDTRAAIRGDGNMYNTNGVYGALSDRNLKENIVASRSYMDDLNKLQVVKFSFKAEESTVPTQLGLIAQDVEEVFPGLVDTDKDGNKNLKYSILNMMMLKTVQELSAENTALKQSLVTATARLDSLEARLAAAGL